MVVVNLLMVMIAINSDSEDCCFLEVVVAMLAVTKIKTMMLVVVIMGRWLCVKEIIGDDGMMTMTMMMVLVIMTNLCRS